MIPVAGSAYTYGYATLGEFIAWIIGWDLILEYALGAANGGQRLERLRLSFLQDFGILLPPKLAGGFPERKFGALPWPLGTIDRTIAEGAGTCPHRSCKPSASVFIF